MNRQHKIIQLEAYMRYVGYKISRDPVSGWNTITPQYRPEELAYSFDDSFLDYEDYDDNMEAYYGY